MSSFKQQLPDLSALQQQFETMLSGNLANFLSSTHVRRTVVLANRNYALFAGVFSIAVLFSLHFVHSRFDGLVWNVFLSCAILWLIIVLLSARQWLTDTRLLAKEMNMALAPIISDTLNRMVVYSSDIDHREETLRLLTESALMTVSGITIISDDMLTVFDETELSLRELVVTAQETSENGKNDTRELFKGMFVVAKLPFTHTAETYISTENDRNGFAHRSFWTNLLGSGVAKETVLEWNDFEANLHVATTDAVAAREVLTPEFMHDLYNWWLEHKLNMRIAIKGNKLYLLLPEPSIKIGFSTSSTNPKHIRTYACSLIRPLWRSLVLVEDVSTR